MQRLDPEGDITYRNSCITDRRVNRANVADHAASGRSRWKVENETFNVLKTGGYHLEHNYGRGKKNLSALLVTLNLLAFAFHTVCDQAEEPGARRGPRQGRGCNSSAASSPRQAS